MQLSLPTSLYAHNIYRIFTTPKKTICTYIFFPPHNKGVSLLWVAALGGVVLFIYAVIVFAFLHESVNGQGEKAFYCETIGQCFISVIRWGLLDNLGMV